MMSNKASSAVRSAINAIQRYKVLNTLTHDCFDKALETEQKLPTTKPSTTSAYWSHWTLSSVLANSPLSGRPILIKDNFCLSDTLTTCASKMLANFRAPYTSTIVQRLIDHGCIIVGKTNMDEFAMGYVGSLSSYSRVWLRKSRSSSVWQAGVHLDRWSIHGV